MADFLQQSLEPDSPEYFMATCNQLKELMNQELSPILEGEGYQYDGRYQWLSPWEDHCRRIICVRLLKGAGAEFGWGYCFDFVPSIRNNLKDCYYLRTDKSAGLQLFLSAQETRCSAELGEFRNWEFSRMAKDLEEVRQLMLRTFQESKPRWEAWFRASQGPENLLAEATRQSQGKDCHWPSARYIQAFLLSAVGRPEEGLQELNAWFEQDYLELSSELKEKLRKKLGECANIIMGSCN